MTSTWGVYLHKSGGCFRFSHPSDQPKSASFVRSHTRKNYAAPLMPLPTTVCNKVPKKKAQGLHWRSMINDAYPSRIHKNYTSKRFERPYCEYKLGYIRLDWCNVFIYIYIYSAYYTLDKKNPIISIASQPGCWRPDPVVAHGALAFLNGGTNPSERLTSSKSTRCHPWGVYYGWFNLALHPTHPLSVLNQVFIKGLLTIRFP